MQITHISKAELTQKLAALTIYKTEYPTPAGPLFVYWTHELGIHHATYERNNSQPFAELKEQLSDLRQLVVTGTQFQCRVWQAAARITASTTISYLQLATALGSPKAFRAVAQALKNNPIGYFIPCHRIIKSSGDLCGYNGGIEKKRALLEAEGAI